MVQASDRDGYLPATTLMVTDARGSDEYRNKQIDLVRSQGPRLDCGSSGNWDQGCYPTGIEITDAEFAAIRLIGHDWHPGLDLQPHPQLDIPRS